MIGSTSREITDRNGNIFALTRDRMDVRSLVSRMQQDTDGAVIVFEGMVRNNNKGKSVCSLEFECDETSAIRSMAQLGVDLARRHKISRFAMAHRLGRVAVGEACLAVVVTAPHREPAFAAAVEAMDRQKTEVAIRKMEHFEENAVRANEGCREALLHN